MDPVTASIVAALVEKFGEELIALIFARGIDHPETPAAIKETYVRLLAAGPSPLAPLEAEAEKIAEGG